MSYCHKQTFNTEEQKTRVKEVLKFQKDFESNVKIDATGYGDPSTFKWLWNKATGNPWDPTSFRIRKSDIQRFKIEANDFISNVGKETGTLARLFKLPKRLLDKMPETASFSQSISDAISFRQRHLRENGTKVDAMLDGLHKMFNMRHYYGDVLTEKQYKEFQDLELRLEVAKTPAQRREALGKIVEKAGLRDSDNNPIAGKILFRFNDLITFRTEPKNEVEREIRDNWSAVRKDSAAMALSGIAQARKTIQSVKDVDTRFRLENAIAKLETAANRIFFETKKSNLKLVKDPNVSDSKIQPNEVMVYDPESNTTKPYRMFNPESGKFEVPSELTQYAPEYVIELANTTRAITDFAANSKATRFKDQSADKILAHIEDKLDFGKLVNRLKAKTDPESEYFYSIDPAFYLNKYIHDIAHFNFATKINMDYKNATDKMLKVMRSGKYSASNHGQWAKGMVDIITDIKDSALNMHEGKIDEMNNAVRMITGIEYVSKLGFSVRGALRNRTQGLFDYIQFGSSIFRKIPKFYDSDVVHVEALNRQYNRFGIKFGEKATAANVAAATKGAIDIDKTNRMDVEKGLTRESMSKSSMSVDTTDKIAEFSADFWGPVSHRAVENTNRINTFRRSFAMSVMEMESNSAYWAKDWKRKHNTQTEPSRDQLRSHIEYLSGNVAANMVRGLHFEYDRWAKAKVFQTAPGQVLGQFQTFKWAFFDLQYQYLKNATKDVSRSYD